MDFKGLHHTIRNGTAEQDMLCDGALLAQPELEDTMDATTRLFRRTIDPLSCRTRSMSDWRLWSSELPRPKLPLTTIDAKGMA